MLMLWKWIVGWLVWLSSDPVAINTERARAAAAVAVAHASLLTDVAPVPTPTPVACDCGSTCVKGVWKPDGRISQKCACPCARCVAERAKGSAACASGTCPTPAK
jgi:hypothetical protein